ncbi:MAG: hypothetical protein NUV63_02995 [Gallionella sp.]|nr:hypothetical protein [Gallionella sp.]
MVYIWLAFTLLTAVAASSRGRSFFLWLLFGLIFGIFALILVLILPSQKRDLPSQKHDPSVPTPETHVRCPDCQELVLWDARKCKHCGCRLIPPPREAKTDRWAFLKSKP